MWCCLTHYMVPVVLIATLTASFKQLLLYFLIEICFYTILKIIRLNAAWSFGAKALLMSHPLRFVWIYIKPTSILIRRESTWNPMTRSYWPILIYMVQQYNVYVLFLFFYILFIAECWWLTKFGASVYAWRYRHFTND